MQVVFFIGTHRTGTKLLANFFQDFFDNVISYHQPNSLRCVNIFSNMYMENVLPEKIFDWLIRMLVVKRITRQPTEIYIEANGYNYISAAYVKKYINNVKVVHLVRDPRDFVRSYINWIHERLKSRFANKMIPFWNPSGYRTGDIPKSVWAKMEDFEKFCWLWKHKNQKILELYADDKVNFITVKFKDIIEQASRRESIQKMLDFIGLPYSENHEQYFNKKQNATRGSYFPKWKDWNSEHCKYLDGICGLLMQKFGYGTETEWKDKLV